MNMIKTAISAFAGLAVLSSAPAAAKKDPYEIDFEATVMKDKDEVPLDPSKAYILLQSPAAIPATFFKVPTDEERELVSKARAAGLEKAHAKWVKRHARWVKQKESKRRSRPLGEEPVEPTEENFGWPPAERSMMFSVGPLNRFAKGKGLSLYLQEVPPGEYTYYGSLDLVLATGSCACMGTVKFDADPGTITMLRYDGVWLDQNGEPLNRGKMPEGVDTVDQLVRVSMIIEPVDEDAYDPRLPRDWMREANFTPVPFVPNWTGSEINRLAPIPGVLAYRRDEVVDVQAELAREMAEKERMERAAAERAQAEAAAERARAEAAEAVAEEASAQAAPASD